MAYDWQTWVALGCVFAAALDVGRRLYGTFQRSSSLSGCGSACSSCPAGKPSEPQLVTLELGTFK